MKSISEWWKERERVKQLPETVKARLAEVKSEIKYLESEIRYLLNISSHMTIMVLTVLGGPIASGVGYYGNDQHSAATRENVARLDRRIDVLKTEYRTLYNYKSPAPAPDAAIDKSEAQENNGNNVAYQQLRTQ